MRYKIRYEKQCLKYLQRLDRNTQVRIIKAINQLPFGDIKLLKGSTYNYRLRVGSYRVIFSKDDNTFTIVVIKIAPRGDAYYKI